MFDPIYNFTGQSFTIFSLFVGGLIHLIILGRWAVVNAIRFVKDEPLLAIFEPYIKKGFCFDTTDQFLVGYCGVCFCLGSFAIPATIAAINWFWFPLSIVGVVLIMLFIARGVVRLKKALNEHKSDPKAHK